MVTVTAAQDSDALAAAAVALTHTPSGGGYAGVTITDVRVTVIEDDRPVVSLGAAPTVAESAGTARFAVALDQASSETVTVGLRHRRRHGGGPARLRGRERHAQPGGRDDVRHGRRDGGERPGRRGGGGGKPSPWCSPTRPTRPCPAARASSARPRPSPTTTTPAVAVAFAADVYLGGRRRRGVGGGGTRRGSGTRSRRPAGPTRPRTARGRRDYQGVPASVVFAAVARTRTFAVTATDDAVDDDGETVALGFGDLPAGVSRGEPSTATLHLGDDDARGVSVSPTALSLAEGASATYAVSLASQPTAAVAVSLDVPSGGRVRGRAAGAELRNGATGARRAP